LKSSRMNCMAAKHIKIHQTILFMVFTLILCSACSNNLDVDRTFTGRSLGDVSDHLFVRAPTSIREGDIRQVTLFLQIDGTDILKSQNLDGDSTDDDAFNELLGIFQTHNILVKTRFDIPGVDFAPRGELFEPLKPGVPVKYNWQIRPGETGEYQGTVWVHLIYIPLADGESEQRLLSIQQVDIRSMDFFGLNGSQARVIGTLGTIIGILLIIDLMIGLLKNSTSLLFTKRIRKNDVE